MTSLARRLTALETRLHVADDRSLAEVLREALAEARERQRLGLTRPLPEGEDPLSQRLRLARLRTEEALTRRQAGDVGPWQ
jgi:hypothetical protein